MTKLIFLAAPYSAPEPEVVRERVVTFTYVMSALEMDQASATPLYDPAHYVSPLLCDLLVQGNRRLPKDFDFWKSYSVTLLDRCDEIWVITMPGWEDSVGVQHEIAHARTKRIPVFHVDPNTLVAMAPI